MLWFLVHLQACRALMVLSLLIGLVSILVSVLGLKCTRLGRSSEQAKGRMGVVGGVLLILSGLNPELSALSSQLISWLTR